MIILLVLFIQIEPVSEHHHYALKQQFTIFNIINIPFRVYQRYVSPQQGDVCNFTPSCSHYSQKAIKQYGIFLGFLMTFDRLERCNYWSWHYRPFYYSVRFVPDRGYKLYDPPFNHLIFRKR